ncbi:GAF domain-containing protein [Radicibacter daui]|uniref:GAF domain-containing protein n=1 Tax=Radicibacter daui TaxID=3064829 RepID=UPI0040469BB9
MQAPAFPDDEEFRTLALDGLNLLDTDPDPAFDTIVALGKALFDVPTCLVTLIDRDRQWFKARVGLEATETPRNISFCGHAILARDVFIIPDAREDARFHDNPLVTGAPFIRFYAGAPILLPNGYTIGTVCLLSPEPRPVFSTAQAARLASLAEMVVTIISVGALRQELDRERAARLRLAQATDLLDQPLAILDRDGKIIQANQAFSALCRFYVAPGLSLLEAGVLSRSDLQAATVGQEGQIIVQPGNDQLARSLILRPDAEGFVLTGAATKA